MSPTLSTPHRNGRGQSGRGCPRVRVRALVRWAGGQSGCSDRGSTAPWPNPAECWVHSESTLPSRPSSNHLISLDHALPPQSVRPQARRSARIPDMAVPLQQQQDRASPRLGRLSRPLTLNERGVSVAGRDRSTWECRTNALTDTNQTFSSATQSAYNNTNAHTGHGTGSFGYPLPRDHHPLSCSCHKHSIVKRCSFGHRSSG